MIGKLFQSQNEFFCFNIQVSLNGEIKKKICMDSGMIPDRESIVLIRWKDDDLIKSIDESKFLD